MLRRNEYLFYQGDRAKSIYIVRSGALKRCLSQFDGEEYILSLHLAGDTLVSDALANGIHGSSAVALEDTCVCIVPMQEINAAERRSADWYRWTLALVDREITRQQMRTLTLRSLNAEGRIVQFLLTMSEYFREQGYSAREFDLRMSRQDIGNYLGLTVETVSRIMTRLKNMGILSLNRRQVTLNNFTKLRSIAGMPALKERGEAYGTHVRQY